MYPAAQAFEFWLDSRVEDCDGLQALIGAELREHRIPGAAIGLLHRDKTIFLRGFGKTDVATGSCVTPRTVFQTGSISKLLTAVLVLILAEEGRIDLHAPIGLHAAGLNASLAGLTAHQLLSHTAGLKDAGLLYGTRTNAALSETLAGWGPEFLFTISGEVFSYSNPGYSLAGLVIECVTGRSFAAAMRERLFAPLGMRNSHVGARLDVHSAFSAGHVMARRRATPVVAPLADNAVYRPAGYIFSTAHDLCRLMTALLNGGVLENRQVLPPAILEQVTAMHAARAGASDRGYGYGLFVDHSGAQQVAGHAGFNAGFGARIWLCGDSRQAIVVLTNRQAQTLPRTMKAAIEMLCGAAEAPRRAPLRRLAPTKDSDNLKRDASLENALTEPMSAYAGTYSQDDPELIVRSDGRSLWLRAGDAEFALKAAGPDRFVCSVSECALPVEIAFTHRQERGFRYLHAQAHAFRRKGLGMALSCV